MAEQTYDEQWLQSSEQHSAPLEDISKVPVVDPSASGGTAVLMSVPGVEFDRDPALNPSTATPVRFVQFRLSTLVSLYQDLNSTVVSTLGGVDAVRDAAVAATRDAVSAAAEAGMVDASLVGTTVTITNRHGESKSANIGFSIAPENVYPSKAAMIADAGNIPAGRFCIIANTTADDPDNATLWARNPELPDAGEGAFTFLSDLDQASSAAWAEWLETMKPQVEEATVNANAAAQDAQEKGTYAYEKGALAASSAAEASAQAERAGAEADKAAELNSHPPYIGDGLDGDKDYWYVWSLSAHRYVRRSYAKGDDLHYDEMTPEERQHLIDDVRTSVISATLAEAVQAAEELT